MFDKDLKVFFFSLESQARRLVDFNSSNLKLFSARDSVRFGSLHISSLRGAERIKITNNYERRFSSTQHLMDCGQCFKLQKILAAVTF